MGMSLADVIAASTVGPADAIRRPDLGTLGAGTTGDATVLRMEPGEFQFIDAEGQSRQGDSQLVAEGMVIAGRWHDP